MDKFNSTLEDVMPLHDDSGKVTHYNFTINDSGISLNDSEVIIEKSIVSEAIERLSDQIPSGMQMDELYTYPAFAEAVYKECFIVQKNRKEVDALERSLFGGVLTKAGAVLLVAALFFTACKQSPNVTPEKMAVMMTASFELGWQQGYGSKGLPLPSHVTHHLDSMFFGEVTKDMVTEGIY